MNNLKNIPKILYLYWDGFNKLSFLQYLTVKSFRDLNPDWEIVIYLPEKPHSIISWKTFEHKTPYSGKDYFSKLSECNVTIKKIDFETIGFRNDVSEVMKSDFLRYYLLGTHGGCWTDFDVLFIKSFNDINFDGSLIYGDKENIDTVIVYSGSYYPVGFLMSSKNNPIFLDLTNACKSHLDVNDYQSIGCKLVKNYIGSLESIHSRKPNNNLLILPLSSYLPYECSQIIYIFAHNAPEKILPNTFGIHWFGGSPISKVYQNSMEGNSYQKNCTIYKYLEKYIHLKN